MKTLLMALVLTLVSQTSNAFERPFRIDRSNTSANGYAVAWGIPGINIDFEKLDTLSDEEIAEKLDYSLVRNFIVDIQTNQILWTIEDNMVVFSIGNLHYGNHYNVSLDKLALQGIGYGIDVIAVTQNYKWSSNVSKILLIDTNEVKLKTIEVDADFTIKLFKEKLRLSILPENLDLFDNAAENFNKIETFYLESKGEVNVISLDYTFPKRDGKSLEVIATVKMKYEDGKIIPYILNVKQKQY